MNRVIRILQNYELERLQKHELIYYRIVAVNVLNDSDLVARIDQIANRMYGNDFKTAYRQTLCFFATKDQIVLELIPELINDDRFSEQKEESTI